MSRHDARKLAKVGIGLLGLLLAWQALRDVSWGEVGQLLGRIDGRALLALSAINMLMLPLMCGRWWLLLRMQGQRVGLASLCSYRIAAGAVSYLTPGPHFGGEPLSVYLLVRREMLSLPEATASVAVDRLLELMASFGIMALCLASLFFSASPPFSNRYHIAAVSLAFLLCLVLLTALVLGGKPLSRPLAALAGLAWLQRAPARSRIEQAASMIEHSEALAQALYENHRRWFLLVNLVSLAHWGAVFTELWLLSACLGVPLTAHQLIALTVVARLSFFTPLPAGIGALELALPWAAASLGLGTSLGVSLCLLIRLRDILFTMAGAIVLGKCLTCSRKASIITNI